MNSLRRCLTLGAKPLIRNYSASKNLVNIKMDDKGIAVMELNSLPVNSLNYDLLHAIHGALVQLENDKCRGMILTSASPSIFCAGLDLNELYNPTVDKAKKFWTMIQDMWIKFYPIKFPTIAAINGHAPAGGCLLAMTCEYRIIVPKVKIGLNEAQIGLIAPEWFQNCMRVTIGERQAELALTSGTMFSAESALKVGLVDEIATDQEDLMIRVRKHIERQAAIPAAARTFVKQRIRNELVHKLIVGREADMKFFLDTVFEPHTQKSLGQYIQALEKSKSK